MKSFLKLFPKVMWKAELVSDKLSYEAKGISKKSIEGAT
jgi:hypothetical protein